MDEQEGWGKGSGRKGKKTRGKVLSFEEGKIRKMFNQTFQTERTESISDVVLPGKITLCESSLFNQENNINILHLQY